MSCQEYRSFFWQLYEGTLFINNASNRNIFQNGLKFIHEDIQTDSVYCIMKDNNIFFLRCWVPDINDSDFLCNCLEEEKITFESYPDIIDISLKSFCEYFDTLYSQELIDNIIVEEADKDQQEFFSKLMELERRIEMLENKKSYCCNDGD